MACSNVVKQTPTRLLVIPWLEAGQTYPGGIAPGAYSRNEIVALLRAHKRHPEVIQFIADMLEE